MNENTPVSRRRTRIAIVVACLPGLLGLMWWLYSGVEYRAAAEACKAESTKASVPWEAKLKHRTELGDMLSRRMDMQSNIVLVGSIVASLVIGVLGAKGKYWLGAIIGCSALVSYLLSADPIGAILAIPLTVPIFMGLIGFTHLITHGMEPLQAKR